MTVSHDKDVLMARLPFRSPAVMLALALCSLAGCHLLPSGKQPRIQDPAWPMSLTAPELVELINQQNRGLTSWRCLETDVVVRMKGVLPQYLDGPVYCKAPNYFRLKAGNLLAAADLGSNSERCWVYTAPIDSTVYTWRHEDAGLIQRAAPEIPRLDPQWMMAILGVTELDPSEFSISRSSHDERSLVLTSTVSPGNGPPMRRIIAADTMRGVVTEHSLYGSDGRLLVRAALSDHQSRNGTLLPRTVTISYPATSTEICLKFRRIEPHCDVADDYWNYPQGVEVVDLGRVIRGGVVDTARPDHFSAGTSPRVLDGYPSASQSADRSAVPRLREGSFFGDEPIFDDVPSDSVRPISHQTGEPDWDIPDAPEFDSPPRRRKWFSLPFLKR
ncbi:MAG: hypothetical protein KDA96_05550 [Planctomycetaceae bacterium]|nr:hypothetical protein [Planctomycetaceae bacterium]